jgi:DNA mismatch repair protein MutS
MTFESIIFDGTENPNNQLTVEMPAFFVDLNLNQIIESITTGRQEYNLDPFFYTPLHHEDVVRYRQEIMQDIENETLAENIKSFARKMLVVRRHLSHVQSIKFKYVKEAWFFEAAQVYGSAANCLVDDLSRAVLKSRGLSSFRDYLKNYVGSGYFRSFMKETEYLKTALSNIKYCVSIKDKTVKVSKYDGEIDYRAAVDNTFARFRQDAARDYSIEPGRAEVIDHVEAQILDRVARLYPDIFSSLDNYYLKQSNFLDETLSSFDREIQFYLAYLDFISTFKRAGLQFCYPQISPTSKEIYNYEGFDLALANKLVPQHLPIVCNDFYLRDKERVLIVSGPNQGGKTTFARTLGQLHYLASLGCPVPGREARLFLFDRIFTHFEKAEDIKDLRGKLEDDLHKIHQILIQATPNSIILINELFISTTLQDAVFLSKKVLEKIFQLDLLCVFVTFIEELASLNEKTVSMVSTVVPENPAVRTYKIIRKTADGLVYAISIAEKYRLTYQSLRERIQE